MYMYIYNEKLFGIRSTMTIVGMSFDNMAIEELIKIEIFMVNII